MKNYILISVVVLCFCGCKFDQSKDIVYPVSHMEALFFADDNDFDQDSLKLIYGDFFDDYKERIVYLPPNDDFNLFLRKMKSHEKFIEAIDLIQKNYQDFDSYELELNNAVVNYAGFFPDKHLPKLVTYFGAFNFPLAVNDSTLAIGLEMFLGSSYYSDLSFKYPPYMHHQFNSQYMVSLAMNEWISSEFPLSRGNFLTNIIHQGKIKYVLSQLVDKQEHIVMGYTKDQLEWCQLSEYSIWKHLITKALLYSNDKSEIDKFINPAPSSRGMPAKSPGQLVNWVGLQIVKKFMKNNPEISVQELMLIQDAQFILQQSKYKAQ